MKPFPLSHAAYSTLSPSEGKRIKEKELSIGTQDITNILKNRWELRSENLERQKLLAELYAILSIKKYIFIRSYRTCVISGVSH